MYPSQKSWIKLVPSPLFKYLCHSEVTQIARIECLSVKHRRWLLENKIDFSINCICGHFQSYLFRKLQLNLKWKFVFQSEDSEYIISNPSRVGPTSIFNAATAILNSWNVWQTLRWRFYLTSLFRTLKLTLTGWFSPTLTVSVLK